MSSSLSIVHLCQVLSFTVLLTGTTPGDDNLDTKLAHQGLKAAVKASSKVYKQEVIQSVEVFGAQLVSAAENAVSDGYQADDLVAIVQTFDDLLLELRGDMEETLQVLGEGASAALADASALPLNGELPAHFRVGGRKTLDKALARIERRQLRVLRQMDKIVVQLQKFLQNAVPVTLAMQVWPPATQPVVAFDEAAVFPVNAPDLTIDVMAAVHEPHLLPTHRAVGAGFATAAGGDVTVERLDLAGMVVDSIVVTPVQGRWLAVLDLPGAGPVVLRARQGVVGATRSLGAP